MSARRLRALALLASAGLGGAVWCGAQEAMPMLPASEAGDYLGDWVLTVKAQQGDFDLDLHIADQGGVTVAGFEMPRLGPQSVRHITKSATGLLLQYTVAFGEQEFAMNMELARSGAGLAGKMADSNGLFSLEFVGVPKVVAAADTSDEARARRRRARRTETQTAKLQLAGHEISLRVDAVGAKDEAMVAVEQPRDGATVEFVKNRPGKFWTPVDLRFGEVTVKAHNHVPDYPGVYSLWLRHQGGKWFLVFNHLADVWGTQHDPAQDAAVVPLEVVRLEQPVDTLTAALEEHAGQGVLKLQWGAQEFRATFAAAESSVQ